MHNLCRSDQQAGLRFCVAVLLAVVCFLDVSAARAAADHRYTVSVNASLSKMRVSAEFATPVRRVRARSWRAGDYAYEFYDCGRGQALHTRNQRLVVPTGGLRCLQYKVDLRLAAAKQRQNRTLDPGNIVVSPSVWLWRPPVRDNQRLLIDFDLPGGMRVSAPWQRREDAGHRYLLQDSPQSANAPVVFGRFEQRDVPVPGAVLRVSLLQGRQPMDNDSIVRWIEAAATDVTLAYGRFPNPSPQVIVVPVSGKARRHGSPVPYGRVVRDGGETIELYINQQQPLRAFLDDWTATHEFSHLLLPYVERRHRWISEGFAQYYQNVLLARAGAYAQQRAWQKLYDGLQRGRASRPDLSPNSAAAGRSRNSTMKVYWSGAAIALMADVKLRELSDGQQTLDSVLRDLQACCLPSDRQWEGMELFAKLDELAGHEIFMPLYLRYANAPGFPDTAVLFERLGLEIRRGRVHVSNAGTLAGIRNAITALDPAVASWRQQLAASAR